MSSRTNPYTSIQSIAPFYGMKTDKGSSSNRKSGCFDLLSNYYSNIDEIRKRKGYTAYVNTHTTGSKVYGIHNQISSNSTKFNQVKVTTGSNNLYFYDIITPGWVQCTAHTFPETDTYMVEMDGFDEWNGSTNVSDTAATGSTKTLLKLTTNTSNTENIFAGSVVRITHSSTNVEYKVVIGNYDDILVFSDTDPLNTTPASGVSILIRQPGNMLYVAGGSEFAVIGTEEAGDGVSGGTSSAGYKQLNGTSYGQNGFTGIENHGNRIFGWKNRRVSFSDLFNGHNFSITHYFDFSSTVRGVKSFNDGVALIYESRRVWALIGTDPDTWELKLVSESYGCNYFKTVSNYSSTSFSMQIFVASDGHVRAITSDTFKQINREAKIMSLTDQYIYDEFAASFNFLCANVDEDGKYTVYRSDNSIYTLNVSASERTGFKEFIWSTGTTPRTFNTAVKISGVVILGDNANGQLYTWNSGYTDNGTAISGTIRRRGLNFNILGDKTKFKRLDIIQGAKDGSTTMTVKCEANNSGDAATIAHTLGTHNPSTGDKLHSYKIPNNPTNNEGTGQMLDYEITESGSVKVAPIENINLRYRSGLLK